MNTLSEKGLITTKTLYESSGDHNICLVTHSVDHKMNFVRYYRGVIKKCINIATLLMLMLLGTALTYREEGDVQRKRYSRESMVQKKEKKVHWLHHEAH